MRILFLIIGVLWACLVQAGGLLVIAHPQVPDAALTSDQLADIYSLKKNLWSDHSQIVPVNREAASKERDEFTSAVFDVSPQELGEYLNRQKFHGKFPPIVQTSDQAVLNFVRRIPGAIGYINANQQPAGVKVLLRLP